MVVRGYDSRFVLASGWYDYASGFGGGAVGAALDSTGTESISAVVYPGV